MTETIGFIGSGMIGGSLARLAISSPPQRRRLRHGGRRYPVRQLA